MSIQNFRSPLSYLNCMPWCHFSCKSFSIIFIHFPFSRLVPSTRFSMIFLINDNQCHVLIQKKLKKQRPPEVPKSEWSQKKQLDPAGPQDLVAKEVHVCICDAQYMRNEVAWDEKHTGVRWDDFYTYDVMWFFWTWRQGDPKKSTLNHPGNPPTKKKRLDHVWMSKTWPNIYG